MKKSFFKKWKLIVRRKLLKHWWWPFRASDSNLGDYDTEMVSSLPPPPAHFTDSIWCSETKNRWNILFSYAFYERGIKYCHQSILQTFCVFGCDSSPRSPNVSLCVCVTLATTVLTRTYKELLKDFWRTLYFMVYKIQ